MTWKVRSCATGVWADEMDGGEHACRARFRALADDDIGAVLMDDRGCVVSRNVGTIAKARRSDGDRDVPPPVPLDPEVLARAEAARARAHKPTWQRKANRPIKSQRKQVTGWPATVKHGTAKRKRSKGGEPASEKQVKFLSVLHRRTTDRAATEEEWRAWRNLSKREAHARIDAALASEREVNAAVRDQVADPKS